MKAQSTGCCQLGRELRRAPPERRGRWAQGTVGGAIFAVLAVLMPKCPLCIVAWLGVLGLSGIAGRVDPRALWLTLAAATALSAALFVRGFILGRHHQKKGQTT